MEENMLVAVYDNQSDAQKAVTELLGCGFSREDVRLSSETDDSISTTAAHPGESSIGHFFRTLFGMEEDRDERDIYSESVRRGSYVLAVSAHSDAQFKQASEIMSRYSPVEDMGERETYWRSQGWTGYDETAPMMTSDEIARDRSNYAQARSSIPTSATGKNKIPVIEEELKVGKREVERGGVRIFTRKIEQPVEQDVQLRDEQVKVERRAVDQPASEADLAAFKEGSIEIHETTEEPVVSKSARVVEEVVVGKEKGERTETIKDTLHRTEVDVEKFGTEAKGALGGMTDDTDFRTHWQTSYATQGGRYEDYAPAYTYGSRLAANDKYKGHQWNEIEPQVRAEWESNNAGTPWEKMKDAVRYGWNKMMP
jgi:uncharacterized protein (TIGR02271 family)